MKILHTADWHLGKRLESFSRLEEQRKVLEEITEVAKAKDVDVVLIAGDLFDTYNPSTEAVELFYKTLKKLSDNGRRAVIAIAGNHDSPDRIEAPDPLALENGIIFSGYPSSQVTDFSLDSGLKAKRSEPGFLELDIPGSQYPLRLLMTPYANEFRLRHFLEKSDEEAELRQLLQERWQSLADSYCDDRGVNVLLSHLFMVTKGQELPEEPEDEKPILHVGGAQAIYSSNIPHQIQYTALGHLHRFQNVSGDDKNPVIYSGSPLSYSFSEAEQKKYVTVVDVEPGQSARFEKIDLNRGRKLVRKRFESTQEAVDWLAWNQDTLVELTLVADEYLTSADRKQLYQAHDGIVTIVPEIRNKPQAESKSRHINLQQSMTELFRRYFAHQHQQEPNEEIMELFKEVQAEKPSE
ncbi:MAG: exonuclease SbcCD subunit D [Bacteroidales bacterium]|nr:exonuclease SbcCD subunit D [Bacteroidales bacterium]MCF8333365.1 exonuclease SbcCD subunit D [Bacteroidales bacterium]